MLFRTLLVPLLLLVLAPTAWADIVVDASDGGDGPTVGTWNATTKTLTLTQDVTEPILIVGDTATSGDDPVTIDGDGHKITGSGQWAVVTIYDGADGSTVRNCEITGLDAGIYVRSGATGIVLSENRIYGTAKHAIYVERLCHGCTVTDNDVSGNGNPSTRTSNLGEGIRILESNGCSVLRNIADDNSYGIRMSLGSGCTISGNRANDCSAGTGSIDAIGLVGMTSSTISGNTVFRSSHRGMTVSSGSGNTISGNILGASESWNLNVSSGADHTISDNQITLDGTDGPHSTLAPVGLRLSGTDDCTVCGNIVQGTLSTGLAIQVGSSSGNTIYNNIFSHTTPVSVDSASGSNDWSIAAETDPNIAGGPSIGGNLWIEPDGTGFSETHADSNDDGFCDDAYSINSSNVDSLPLRDLRNERPTCSATGGGTHECGSAVTLGGSVADADGDLLSYEWRSGTTVLFSGTVQAASDGSPVALPNHSISGLEVGVHAYTLTVDDGIAHERECEAVVEVVDTTAPTLVPSPSVGILWPPNHTMRTVTVTPNANDACDGDPTITVSVVSDEPDDGLGDGDTANDIQNVNVNAATGAITLDLRAERSGGGVGRTYTVTVTATDASGNAASTEVLVVVPHSKKK